MLHFLIMATAKKTGSKKKTSKKAAPKAAKKRIIKQEAPKKSNPLAKKTAKKPTQKRLQHAAPKKTGRARAKLKVDTRPKKVIVTRTRFWYYLSSSMVLVIVMVGSYFLMNEQAGQQLMASVIRIAQVSMSEDIAPAEEAPLRLTEEGYLITRGEDDPNAAKLLDIFATIFPDIQLEQLAYQTAREAQLRARLSYSEIPTVIIRQDIMQQQDLINIVQELFREQGDYYLLDVSLVNPSGQTRIDGPPALDNSAVFGAVEAPLSVYFYSDIKCLQCRAHEKNTLELFKGLMEEGKIRFVIMDLPQSEPSDFPAYALACVYQEVPESYFDFRRDITDDARQSSKPYVMRELKRLVSDYEEKCNQSRTQAVFQRRLQLADEGGISAIPTVQIGLTGRSETIRITGAKDFAVYQEVMDQLLPALQETEDLEERLVP